MSIKRKILNLSTQLLKKLIQLLGMGKANAIMAHLSESIVPILTQKTNFGTISFFCPSEISEWRAKTFFTKEPETIEWIDGLNDGGVFWDIGANVGTYSLYAALRGLSILAFEPSPSNYYLLSKNIELNKVDEKISSYCIAFNHQTGLDALHMSSTGLGDALNNFGEARDWQGSIFTAVLKQGMIGFSVDDFIKQFNPPFPNYIKIDVDGIEGSIIRGAKHTLIDSRLKSVLVELNIEKKEPAQEVISIFNTSGFTLLKREHAPMVDEGKFANVYNHIFIRR